MFEIKRQVIVEQRKSSFGQLSNNKYRISNNLLSDNKIEREKRINKF